MAKGKLITNSDLFKQFCLLSPVAQVMVIQGVQGQCESVIEHADEIKKEGTGCPIIAPDAWIEAAKHIKELLDMHHTKI